MRKTKPKQIDHYQIRFDQEVFVDLFAGGGGASMGIEEATGLPVYAAVNHDPDAIALHMANHRFTKHYQTSVWDVEPEIVCEGRPVGLLWASPDCKHFSKARGGKPVNKQIRSLSWVVIKWALDVRPRVLMMENVEEIQTWGPLISIKRGKEKVWVPDPEHSGETFMAFIGMLSYGVPSDHPALEEACHYLHIGQGDPRRQKLIDGLGYAVEYRELVAADYGAPTTRKRFMLCGRCDGKPIAWPERTHAPRDSQEVKSGKCKPWRSAAEIIDWSLPAYSIFETKEEILERYGAKAIRPLADNTMRRIIRGVDKFTIKSGKPFIVPTGYGERAGQQPRVNDIADPLGTVVGTCKHNVLQPVVTPFMAQCNHSGDGHISCPADPVGTILAKHTEGVVTPIMAPITLSNTGGSVGAPASDPVHTIRTAGGQMLSAAQFIQYHTEQTDYVRAAGLEQPINTVDAANRYGLATVSLVEYYGNGNPLDIAEPMHTVTAHDREAIVSAHITKYFGGVVGADMSLPLPTVTVVDHNALAAAHVAEFKGQDIGQPAMAPLRTITAGGGQFGEVRTQIVRYSGGQDLKHWPKIRQLLNEHCGYRLAEDEVILLLIGGIAWFIGDITLRMLTPRELYNAMGFPPDYIIDVDYLGRPYAKNKQVARCGNAVCPPMARAMVQANLPEYCVMIGIQTLAEFERRVSV